MSDRRPKSPGVSSPLVRAKTAFRRTFTTGHKRSRRQRGKEQSILNIYLLLAITPLSQFKIFSHLAARLYEHCGKGCRYLCKWPIFWYRFSFLQLGTLMMPVCGSKLPGFLSTCKCSKVNKLIAIIMINTHLPADIVMTWHFFFSTDGQFPINLSKFQVEKDHSFLEQSALDALIRCALVSDTTIIKPL